MENGKDEALKTLLTGLYEGVTECETIEQAHDFMQEVNDNQNRLIDAVGNIPG